VRAFEPFEAGDHGVGFGVVEQQRVAGGQGLDVVVGQSPMSSISRTSSRPRMTWAMNLALRVTTGGVSVFLTCRIHLPAGNRLNWLGGLVEDAVRYRRTGSHPNHPE